MSLKIRGAEEYREFALQEFIWKNGKYGDIVTTLKANLTEEQLKISFFEDIHRDQRKWLRELEDFLGVRHVEYPSVRLDAKVNPSAKLSMPAYFPEILASEIAEQLAKLEDAGFEIPNAWRQVNAPVLEKTPV